MFKYPKQATSPRTYIVDNPALRELFAEWARGLPPGMYRSKDLRASFNESIVQCGIVEPVNPQSFGKALSANGFLLYRSNGVRYHIKQDKS